MPEFERARKALQYAGSIDDYVRIMNTGDNGDYANDCLLGDRKTGEIARFEDGLKHRRLWCTKAGYYAGANFPSDPQVTSGETTFNPNDPSDSDNARRVRWDQLLEEYKGKIDSALAEQFLGDHYDTYTKKQGPDERTLCSHIDVSPDGPHPYGPFRTTQGKVADSEMAAHLSFIVRLGHPCGENFYAAPFLAAHPQFARGKSILGDMPAYSWTAFSAGENATR